MDLAQVILPKVGSIGLSGPLSPPSSETGSNGSSSPSASPVKKGTKPVLSYIALIAKAILNTSECRLLLSDIYQYIMDNYAYYRNNDRSWRNSIRHNLSLNECFIKNGRSNDGRGHFWAIHPANVEDFMRGDYRRRRARLRVRATITAKTYETPYHPYSTPNQMYGGASSPYVTMSGSPPSMVGLPYAASPYMAQTSLPMSTTYDMMSYSAAVPSVNSTMSMTAPPLITPSFTGASYVGTSYAGATSSCVGSQSNALSSMTSPIPTSSIGSNVCIESITPPSSPENQALIKKTLYNNRVATTINYTNTFTTQSNAYNCNQMIPSAMSFSPAYYPSLV